MEHCCVFDRSISAVGSTFASGTKEMFLVAELTVIQMLKITGLALLPTAVVQTYRFFSDAVV